MSDVADSQADPPTGGIEPCAECGAPLATDQRYCLNCGRRRGEPRLDFRRHLTDTEGSGDRPAAAPVQPAGAPPEKQRDFAPLAAAGGIAVLGLMLLVGVLIGRGDGEPAAAPGPPQVVRVQGGEGEATGREGGGAKKGNGARNAGSKGSGKKGGGRAAAAPPPAAITADDSELEALQQQSPQEYSEASAKLPDEIATEGKPPPKDKKKPGGGSAGTTIE